MKHYAIQTELSIFQIHEKLGFDSVESLMIGEFDDSKEQVYIMSTNRIETNNIDTYSTQQLMDELHKRDIREADFRKFLLYHDDDVLSIKQKIMIEEDCSPAASINTIGTGA